MVGLPAVAAVIMMISPVAPPFGSPANARPVGRSTSRDDGQHRACVLAARFKMSGIFPRTALGSKIRVTIDFNAYTSLSVPARSCGPCREGAPYVVGRRTKGRALPRVTLVPRKHRRGPEFREYVGAEKGA